MLLISNKGFASACKRRQRQHIAWPAREDPFSRSASTLCWDEIDRQGYSRNETVQIGTKWAAAFMVSCARHGATDFRSILVPSDRQQAVLRREAARNDGVIAQILEEAASTAPRVFSSAVFPTGLHWINNPSGRDKTLDP